MDGDEGFDEEEEEQRQPSAGEGAWETGREAKLEILRRDWESLDGKGQGGGDSLGSWRWDERAERPTGGGGSFGEIKLDLREARAERDANKRGQIGRTAAEENAQDSKSSFSVRMKKEI